MLDGEMKVEMEERGIEREGDKMEEGNEMEEGSERSG